MTKSIIEYLYHKDRTLLEQYQAGIIDLSKHDLFIISGRLLQMIDELRKP